MRVLPCFFFTPNFGEDVQMSIFHAWNYRLESPLKLAAISAIQAGQLPSINHQPDRIWLWALGVAAGKPTIGTTYTVDNAAYLGEKYIDKQHYAYWDIIKY